MLLPLGLAIILNLVIFAGGLLWAKRQVKRVEVERKAEYRGLFQLEPLPPPGDEVQILVEEDDGRTSQLEAVHWPHLGWTDAVTLLRVEGDVLGWRRHPFAPAPATDLRDPHVPAVMVSGREASWIVRPLAAACRPNNSNHHFPFRRRF